MSLGSIVGWDQYQKLSPDQRSRPLTDAEYAALSSQQRQSAGLEDRSEGAPAKHQAARNFPTTACHSDGAATGVRLPTATAAVNSA